MSAADLTRAKGLVLTKLSAARVRIYEPTAAGATTDSLTLNAGDGNHVTLFADDLADLLPDPDDSIDTPDHVLDAYEAARAEPAPVTLAPGDTVWITVDAAGHGLVHPCEAAADVAVRLSRRRPLTKVRLAVMEVRA